MLSKCRPTRAKIASAEVAIVVWSAFAMLVHPSLEKAAAAELRVLDVAPKTLRLQKTLITYKTPTRVRQSQSRLAALEANMIARVNQTRRRFKLSELRSDTLLAEVARAHSGEMRDKNYFAHESPTPALKNPLDRYRAGFGDTPAIVAENIYRAWSSAKTVPRETDILRAHNALLNSPGHRKNILEARVTNIGIGIVQNANGDIWITQMFSRPTW